MSQTISFNLPDELVSRLDRFARMLGNGATRTSAGVLLLDEALREKEFAGVEFRNTAIGRLPFVKNTGMAVWEFVMVAQEFEMNAEQTAAHLEYSVQFVNTALDYYRAHPDEINRLIQDNDTDEETRRQQSPQLRTLSMLMHEREASA
jgi:predicted transcriptional regulator